MCAVYAKTLSTMLVCLTSIGDNRGLRKLKAYQLIKMKRDMAQNSCGKEGKESGINLSTESKNMDKEGRKLQVLRLSTHRLFYKFSV